LTAADEARIDALVKTALPDPGLGSDEVLVDVELANITFADTLIRAGRPPYPAMSAPLPAVLGNDVGGGVAAVGQGEPQPLAGGESSGTFQDHPFWRKKIPASHRTIAPFWPRSSDVLGHGRIDGMLLTGLRT
jgi:NADPH2:quinone reductase